MGDSNTVKTVSWKIKKHYKNNIHNSYTLISISIDSDKL